MAAPDDGSSVPAERRLLRLPAPPKDFVPERWSPSWQDLAPSSDDKQHAESTGRPVRVSVWDAALTTTDQALSFRGRATLVITAQVNDVVAAGATAVVYDRLEAPDADRPGAAGHAGIEGLVRQDGEPRTAWKTRLQRIADVFHAAPPA